MTATVMEKATTLLMFATVAVLCTNSCCGLAVSSDTSDNSSATDQVNRTRQLVEVDRQTSILESAPRTSTNYKSSTDPTDVAAENNVSRTRKRHNNRRHDRSKEVSRGQKAQTRMRRNERRRRQLSARLSNTFTTEFAVQFSLNETAYSGLTQDSKMTTLPWWIPANWSRMNSEYFHYDAEAGRLEIRKTGVYYLYGQVTYYTQAASSGFTLVTESCSSAGLVKQNLIACTFEQRHSDHPDGEKSSTDSMAATCHAGGQVYLNGNSRVFVENNSGGYFRPMVMNPWSTFWGLYKVA